MLDEIQIQGLKSFDDARVALRRINLLIGANGSGKSNLLTAFRLLQLLGQDPDQARLQKMIAIAGGAEQFLHLGSKRTPSLSLGVSFDKGDSNLYAELTRDHADRLLLTGAWSHPPVSNAFGEKEPLYRDPEGIQVVPDRLRKLTGDWRVYHFRDTSPESPLRRTQDLHDNRCLRPDGSNLAPLLYRMRNLHKKSYASIRRAVKSFAPFFDDFELEPTALNQGKIRLEWRQLGSESYFDAASLSDGTLRFIALSTLLLQPRELRPSLLLIDEPELGMHPSAISLLAALLKKAANHSQIVVATQSAKLLDFFEPEDVIVADREFEATKLRRLDSAALNDWLEEYSLGELWEKNEFGGRPGNEKLQHAGNH